jgi:hypothetical protein
VSISSVKKTTFTAVPQCTMGGHGVDEPDRRDGDGRRLWYELRRQGQLTASKIPAVRNANNAIRRRQLCPLNCPAQVFAFLSWLSLEPYKQCSR